jgi:hypothetical protein
MLDEAVKEPERRRKTCKKRSAASESHYGLDLTAGRACSSLSRAFGHCEKVACVLMAFDRVYLRWERSSNFRFSGSINRLDPDMPKRPPVGVVRAPSFMLGMLRLACHSCFNDATLHAVLSSQGRTELAACSSPGVLLFMSVSGRNTQGAGSVQIADRGRSCMICTTGSLLWYSLPSRTLVMVLVLAMVFLAVLRLAWNATFEFRMVLFAVPLFVVVLLGSMQNERANRDAMDPRSPLQLAILQISSILEEFHDMPVRPLIRAALVIDPSTRREVSGQAQGRNM